MLKNNFNKKCHFAVSRVFKTLAIPRKPTILLHSSFKNLSREGYRAELVLSSITDYMKPGNLLLPTMSWRYVHAKNPRFHYLNTPSNTGILSAIFLKKFNVLRSIHPTHSVAGLGKDVESILSTHHLDNTPCSKKSPFSLLARKGGYIVMMGIGFDCCTLIHCAEELIAPDLYLEPIDVARTYKCTDHHKKVLTVQLRRHLYLPRNYWQFQDLLAEEQKIKIACLGSVVCIAFKAKDLLEIVVRRLQKDPRCIISRDGQKYRMM